MSQLAPRTENFGPGDQSWLGSRHGVENAVTGTLDVSASSSKIVDGYIKSGEPLAHLGNKKYAPYNSGGSSPLNTLAGFLMADTQIIAGAGDATIAVGKHLFVRKSKLPSAIPSSPTTTGVFIFLD